jgi:hypothetical protein
MGLSKEGPMFRSMMCAVALLMAAPAVADQAKISIHPQVWSWYQDYLDKIGGTKKGTFAVAVDGYAAGWKYCPGQRCKPGTTYRDDALQACRQNAEPGVECVIFAKDREIVIPYEVLE